MSIKKVEKKPTGELKNNLRYLHTVEYFGNKKEWFTDTHDSRDESQNNYAHWKKTRQIIYCMIPSVHASRKCNLWWKKADL